MFDIVEESVSCAKVITVVGVGGGGIRAVNRMTSMNMGGTNFIAVDTNATDFSGSKIPTKIEIDGKEPQEIQEEIIKSLEGSDIVFIVAGMGGDTGSRLASIIAAYAKGLKTLTVAVVTCPSSVEDLENKLLLKEKATLGLKNLRENADATVIIPIDKLLTIVDNKFSLADTFNNADEILSKTVQSISTLINLPGLVNLDFADLAMMLGNSGVASVGIGEASGSAVNAAKNALASPSITGVKGAHSILISFMGAEDSLSLMEVNDASVEIQDVANPEAEIMWGMSVDNNLGDTIRVVIIATNFYS